jgi:glycogen operon protein
MLQLAVFLNGDVVAPRGRHGEVRRSDTFYLCFNAYWQDATFTLPAARYGATWTTVLDTASPAAPPAPWAAGASLIRTGRSVAVLRRDGAELAATGPA